MLIHVALIVVCAPLAGVIAAIRIRASGAQWFHRSPASAMIVAAWRLARLLMTWITSMTAAFAAIAFVAAPQVDASTMVQSHAIVWAVALLFTMVGATCASMFSEPLDAAACAMTVALSGAVGIFAASPMLDAIPRWLLDGALILNPFVAVSSAASFDLFRTELLYQLSPLAHRHVDYPAPATAFVTYVLLAFLLLLVTARRFNRRAGSSSVERMGQ